jgi:hypothetical protein
MLGMYLVAYGSLLALAYAYIDDMFCESKVERLKTLE